MVKIMIDMTSRPHKRYRSGIALCHYCRHDLFPHGKMFDVSTDKDAIQIKNGSYKCGVCVREDLRRQLNY
jgi:ribosomal protein L37AE/L43A